MSITTTEAGTTPEAVPALTFKQRLAQRRRELEDSTPIELEVPGYEGLWARYRVMGYEEIRSVGLRVEAETDDPVTRERLTAATSLADACIELLERLSDDAQGRPVFQSTGYRWSAAAARDLFDKELPDGVVGRDAVIAVFPYPRDLLLMTHYEDYLAATVGYLPEMEKVLQGESQAPSGATTSDSSPQPPTPESP